MDYAYHTQQAAAHLNAVSALASQFYAEHGPGTPPNPADIREQAAFLHIPQPVMDALCRTAALVAADPQLTALYTGLQDSAQMHAHHAQVGGPMQALALFGTLPRIRDRHRAMGVPECVTQDTFWDLMNALALYAAKQNGAFGIDHYGWLRNHFEARLFQVGRLQYILRPYTGYVRAYVNDVTGDIVLTARAGVPFRGDGLMDFEGGPPKQRNLPVCESHWVSEYEEEGGTIRANCLLVNGRALQTQVVLDKAIWRLALEEGMPSLNMHIPRGQALSRAACIDSLRAAWHFFRKLCPDTSFETYNCGSWLLETGLADILPPSSGIVQFLRLFRRYPLTASSWSFVDRVFDADPSTVDDLAAFARTADRSTSLRRGIADYWLSGGRLSSAGGIIHQYDVLRLLSRDH